MILSFSNRYRYFVYTAGCDMRKDYDGLSGLVRNEFKKDPLFGDVFIFLSRTRNKIKLLHWQGDGRTMHYIPLLSIHTPLNWDMIALV